MGRKNIIIIVASCAVSLLTGFWIGKTIEGKLWQGKVNEVIQSELDWLKSQMESSYSFLSTEGFYRLSGTVFQKGDGYLAMEAQIAAEQYPLSPEENLESRDIRVNVDDETDIFRYAAGESPSAPPQKMSLTFADIASGDYLLIVSEGDVRGKEEITAKEIQITSQ
jgi:hypothetical protein